MMELLLRKENCGVSILLILYYENYYADDNLSLVLSILINSNISNEYTHANESCAITQ